jgi:ABC-2 type transport system ATP-binding protein
MSEPAIVAEGIVKIFPGDVRAVDGVSFEVRAGEVYGFLGPNGAGKTTTVSILTTLLGATAGRALVDGVDITANPKEVRKRIGLAFQASTADGELTGRENLEVAAALQHMPKSEARPRIESLLARMDLKAAADRLVKGYSGGMRRRLELAVGLVHSPRVLFLDEPTLGLDPQGRAGFWEYIRELRKETGLTLFLTTHYLEEADQLCDRIAVVDHGKIVASGSPGELKERMGGDTVVVRPSTPGVDLLPVLGQVPGALGVELVDGAYRIRCARGEAMVAPIVRACEKSAVELAGVEIRKPSLDEVFLQLTGREYREEEEPAGGRREGGW